MQPMVPPEPLSRQRSCAFGKHNDGGQIGSRLGDWPILPSLARA